MSKLCCDVNPCYICDSCGFRECTDCWDKTRESRQGHFAPDDKACRVTGERVEPPHDLPAHTVAIWKAYPMIKQEGQ